MFHVLLVAALTASVAMLTFALLAFASLASVSYRGGSRERLRAVITCAHSTRGGMRRMKRDPDEPSGPAPVPTGRQGRPCPGGKGSVP